MDKERIEENEALYRKHFPTPSTPLEMTRDFNNRLPRISRILRGFAFLSAGTLYEAIDKAQSGEWRISGLYATASVLSGVISTLYTQEIRKEVKKIEVAIEREETIKRSQRRF